jgi:hypothetical protein
VFPAHQPHRLDVAGADEYLERQTGHKPGCHSRFRCRNAIFRADECREYFRVLPFDLQMKSRHSVALPLFAALVLAGSISVAPLDAGWQNPPTDARLRAYWWWLNGNVTSNSITHDLEQMKAKGFGGACLIDAGGASQRGNDHVPHGPTFFTPEWRALYKHTLNEANRLGLEIDLNIQSGWNLGGILWCPPWHADITDAVEPGENNLQIAVVNFWPNRIIGDASLPPAQRFTRTNIRALTARTPLMESGMFGPVRLLRDSDP